MEKYNNIIVIHAKRMFSVNFFFYYSFTFLYCKILTYLLNIDFYTRSYKRSV